MLVGNTHGVRSGCCTLLMYRRDRVFHVYNVGVRTDLGCPIKIRTRSRLTCHIVFAIRMYLDGYQQKYPDSLRRGGGATRTFGIGVGASEGCVAGRSLIAPQNVSSLSCRMV